ncbi:uncharacterized protein EI90DRAFT_2914938, partial [Cantharellus anzutake]|uniref:uncharacterized protein n=1 Tax=Cantharellus anzutake TaxID=1750568 RepID=UPI0019048806
VLDQQDGYGLDGDSIRIGKWTPYKWALVVSISVMFVISMGGILASLAIWLRTFLLADVILVINWDLVLYSTVASGCILITSLVGITGAILNSRPFLTFYNILLWPCLISLTTVGYTSYKRRAFNLLGKINQGWSRQWGDYGRLVIQNSLHCCGLYNPLHLAIFSKTCYPRSTLPACRPKLSRFQISVLNMFTRAAFSVTGIILLSIVVAVICSNHVNRLFGKGLMPFQYRLRMGDVRANARAVSLKSLGRAVQPKTVLRPGSIEPV